jgi:Tfp pilus assembly protein PilF
LALHPPPLSLGASDIAVWGSGGEEWEDAASYAVIELEVPGACRVDALRLVPHLPTGRREVLAIRVEGEVGRYRARHAKPIVVALTPMRRRRLRIDIESLLGYPLGVAAVQLIGSREDCDASWAPRADVSWSQLDRGPDAWLRFARAYPRHPPLALARSLRDAGRERDALAVLRGALARVSARAVAWIERGLTEDALAERRAALASYRRAVWVDSNSAWARGCLGWARLRIGDPLGGLWHAWRAASLADDYADARTIIGIALYDLGFEGLGRRFFEKAIALDPHRSWAYLELARRLAATGARDEALSLLDEYLSLAPLDADARGLAARVAAGGAS